MRYVFVALAALAALARPHVTYAQANLRVRVGRCSAIAGDLERVACYDSLAHALGFGQKVVSVRSAGSGRWRTDRERNPLDDTPTITLSLAATKGRSRFGQPVRLFIRCRSHEVEVFIDWASYLGLDETQVTSRIGAEDAASEAWSNSTDNQAAFYQGDKLALVRRLAAASTYVAQVTPYDESPVTAVFDVGGLQSALGSFRQACPEVATP
jgi:type VI secretion system protein VasI